MLMKAPEKHGFDAARLNRIPAFLKERYLDSGKLPNAQILISRDGEIVHFSRLGASISSNHLRQSSCTMVQGICAFSSGKSRA